jgi:hypothetical protein
LSYVATWAEENNAKVDGYQWSPNSQQIEFTYWGATSRASGLCKIEIENQTITCLLDEGDLAEPDSNDSINYILGSRSWSPDGLYLSFVTDHSSPEADDTIYYRVATITNDGSQFQVWGYGYEASWRPPINP